MAYDDVYEDKEKEVPDALEEVLGADDEEDDPLIKEEEDDKWE